MAVNNIMQIDKSQYQGKMQDFMRSVKVIFETIQIAHKAI